MRAPFLLSALAYFAFQSAFANDLIILKNGDRFSGTIVGLSSGLVQIQSPHSDQPWSIVSDDLENLSFEEVETIEAPAHSHPVNPVSHTHPPLPTNDSMQLTVACVTLHTSRRY